MNSLMIRIGLGVALGATALTTAVPAEAQRWRGGYGRHYDNGAGTAVVAGIAGLAVGAALASSRNDRYRDGYYREPGYHRYYDDGYYRDRGYYARDGYRDGYYDQRYRGGYDGCYVERRWDRYYDRPVNVRVCR